MHMEPGMWGEEREWCLAAFGEGEELLGEAGG